MKSSGWAREQGISYRSALNWFHAGTLAVPARQLATGTILIEPVATLPGRTVAYCRVSSVDQKDDLERQAGRVPQTCGQRGLSLDATITEVGSGLNGHRVKLRKLLADPAVTTIVVSTATGWPTSVSSTWRPRCPRPGGGSWFSTRTRSPTTWSVTCAGPGGADDTSTAPSKPTTNDNPTKNHEDHGLQLEY